MKYTILSTRVNNLSPIIECAIFVSNTCSANATEIIEIEYKLPPGPNQAVRVRYDYEGDVSTCPATSYGDVDDLGK